MAIPDDIFTEPDSSPDTLAHLGPLARLAGVWEGRKGVDVNPKADGPERRTFNERYVLQPIDPQTNGPQLFYGLRYHTHITTDEELITFHDQVGYWLYEPATGLILQTLAIPRGQVALASGYARPGDNTRVVSAERGRTDYGICSNGFLEDAFRTDRYELTVTFNPDGSWSYVARTSLVVHGQDGVFNHQDSNTLIRIADPDPTPWSRRLDLAGGTG